MKPDIQVKLLRVLQESSFERLGSARSISSDFRVIAATNKDLYAEVEKGSFRHDLFYRLNVFPLHIPPLRARKGDVNLLVNFFIKKYCKRFGKYIQHIPGDELEKLLAYQWPGNVRELKHLVERAVILYDGGQFRFSRVSGQHPAGEENGSKKFVPLADFEKKYIKQVLEAVHWKLSGPESASAILDMKPTTLLYRMKKLGIRKPEPVL